MNARMAVVAGVLLGAGAALGQNAGFNIEPIFAPGQTAITPRTPSCVVRIWARFDPRDFAMAGYRADVVAGDGNWSQNRNLSPLTIGANPGVVGGSSVTGIVGGQLNFPAQPILIDPSNPIGVWEAVWTTTDFTPRRVSLSTRTARFDVYPVGTSPSSTSRLSTLTEGMAELLVEDACYADCDTSTGPEVLDIFDFLCFQNLYEVHDPYACDCDTGTGVGRCDVFDFLCFQNAFAAGCP